MDDLSAVDLAARRAIDVEVLDRFARALGTDVGAVMVRAAELLARREGDAS